MSSRFTEPCPDRLEDLDRYLDGGETVPELQEHLETCKGCSRYVRRLQGIEAFLKKAHDEFEKMPPGALKQRRRIVPHKVAVWAVLLVMVAGGIAYLSTQLGTGSGIRSTTDLVARQDVQPEEGRVILTTGAPAMLECGPGHSEVVRLGTRVGHGCMIDVPEDASVAVYYQSGLTLLAGSGSRFSLVRSGHGQRIVRVEDGLLGLHSDVGDQRVSLVALAGSDRIESRGRLLTVKVASGKLDRVTAVEGGLSVRDVDGRQFDLSGGQTLDGATRTTGVSNAEDEKAAVVLGLLAGTKVRSTLTVLATRSVPVRVDGQVIGTTPLSVMLAEGEHDVSLATRSGTLLLSETVRLTYGQEERIVYEEVYAVAEPEPETEEPPQQTPAGKQPTASKPSPGTQVDIVALIREALAAGETAEALTLVEKHWSQNKNDASFLSVAGDTYRKLGRFEEAVSAYTSAASQGSGTSAEKAYLAAARITLENLRDASAAQKLLFAYWTRYPSGFYKNEAQFLGARVMLKQKRYNEARSQLEALLSTSPKGYLATKAHLLLGSILVTYLSDCASAKPHLMAVKNAAPGGKYASEADRFLDACTAP